MTIKKLFCFAHATVDLKGTFRKNPIILTPIFMKLKCTLLLSCLISEFGSVCGLNTFNGLNCMIKYQQLLKSIGIWYIGICHVDTYPRKEKTEATPFGWAWTYQLEMRLR